MLPGAILKNNCLDFAASLDPWIRVYAEQAANARSPAPLIVRYKGQPSTLSAQITEVDFADGTSWKL